MTTHTPEERKAFMAARDQAKAIERIADAAEQLQNLTNAVMAQTAVLASIDDTLTGVVNVLDQLDTNLGHHIGALVEDS